MPDDEQSLQGVLYALEKGRFATIIKGAAFLVALIAVILLYLFVQFRGLGTVTAMDQAQIARNLASGKGFTTDYVRPLVVSQMQKRAGGETGISVDRLPDISQSPLNPFVNSLFLGVTKAAGKISITDMTYSGDRLLAGVSIAFFLLAVLAWYFTASQLFDPQLARFSCFLVLVTDLLWQFSLSALPQMLMLLLFSLALLATVLAANAQTAGNRGRVSMFLIAAGVIFGLLALTHGLAFWPFLGWLVFAVVYFRPRGLAATFALIAFVVVVTPWLIRNYSVSGNPFGLGLYDAAFNGVPENTFLRENSVDFSKMASFPNKIRTGIVAQMQELFAYLGLNLAAGAFFLCLLHPFRKPEAAALRWGVLSMWVFAIIGMSLFGGVSSAISSNQLHVLFIPVFATYGLAFLLVLWNRLNFNTPLLRLVFLTTILIVCAIPMLLTLFAGRQAQIQWPPYIPPYIGALGQWFEEEEMVASDMPWAVAWYAQRKSLLLPQTVRELNRIHDYNTIKQPLRGIFLTPVSGNQPLFSGIYKGIYREWAPLIVRPPQTKGFPFASVLPLPIDGECILFTDRERWKEVRLE